MITNGTHTRPRQIEPDIKPELLLNKFDDGTGDLSRERKDSFFWYQKVIATNGEDLN